MVGQPGPVVGRGSALRWKLEARQQICSPLGRGLKGEGCGGKQDPDQGACGCRLCILHRLSQPHRQPPSSNDSALLLSLHPALSLTLLLTLSSVWSPQNARPLAIGACLHLSPPPGQPDLLGGIETGLASSLWLGRGLQEAMVSLILSQDWSAYFVGG